MRLTRTQFVLRFLACGFAFHFVTKLLLGQAPEALGSSPNQAPWQAFISTILWPIKLVLVGPILWLQQDPDPPPPLRMILLAIYWSLLALGIHALLRRRSC